MKYLSLFSGIGGFELGIEQAYSRLARERQRDSGTRGRQETLDSERVGDTQTDWSLHNNTNSSQATCIGYSEIDKYAIKVYERNFNGHTNYGDCTTINAGELPDFDLLVGGFPCQAFSVAGKRAGFNDTRGTLFFDIARILKEKRPRHLVLENVKGLLSHDSGRTFTTILGVLTDLGYLVEWQVLNSKDFGVPQNRERIYIIGHLRGECGRQVLPITRPTGKDIEVVGYLNSPTWQKRNESIRRVYSTDGVSPTIPTGTGGGVMPKIANTIDANYYKGINSNPGHASNNRAIEDGTRIRRLTPRECERLQGFPDDWTGYGVLRKWNDWKNQVDYEPISDTQRYKMCGNAVTVNVVEAVITNLMGCLTAPTKDLPLDIKGETVNE